ncbi:uncharacterized protein JCM10292_005514 [Rhodotorula paludigena]|uniref:uncharacterized protein n=1 Tax=Rhodotorula paludigena TaxID=86838 RepID=UPI00317CBFA6
MRLFGRPHTPPRLASSTVALSDSCIVDCVLEQLVGLYGECCDHKTRSTYQSYPDLRACSLVSRAFRLPAQRLLADALIFVHGRGVRRWIEHAPKDKRYPNRFVALFDEYPFNPATSRGDGAKWSYEDLVELGHAVQETQIVVLQLVGQRGLPGDLLSGRNLAGLRQLHLYSPLERPTRPFRFRLEHLTVADEYHCNLNRNWRPSLYLLGSSGALDGLKTLNLAGLPFPQDYVLDLARAAPSLVELSLPSIDWMTDLWPLYVFAAACTSLTYLSIETLDRAAAEVLRAFPTGPCFISINSLVALVGLGDPFVDQRLIDPADCPVYSLIAALHRKEPLGRNVERLYIGHLRWTSQDLSKWFDELEDVVGTMTDVDEIVTGLSKDELLPAAPTVQQLSFATLPSIRSYWPLYVFASLCTALQELRFWNLYGREPEVLLPFPTGPPSVFVRALVSPVGYAHPLVDQTRVVPLESAPFEVLARVVERKERPMRRLAIAVLKVPTGAKEADGRLSRACGLRGIQLELYSIRSEVDDDEKSILDVLIKQSESRRKLNDADKPSTTPVELEAID